MSETELSRPMKARQLPADPVIVEANEQECAALAKRFGLPRIDSLRAEVMLAEDGKAVLATGTLEAAIVQNCAVSHEEFDVAVNEPLSLRFVPEGTIEAALSEDEEIEIELSSDDCDEIEYSGEMFDLGEAIAQSLGLAIDPYAIGPDADATRKDAGIVQEGEQAEGPLAAALAALKKE